MTDSISPHVLEHAAAPLPHILIAEDDTSSSLVLRTVLERASYRVTLVADGAAAMRELEIGDAPDVLLLDWMLPGMTGLEVCNRARQRWDAVELPILMVTARTDAESIAAAFDAGANDYITKPYLGAELRARVAAHLRTRQLVAERQRIEEHLRERERLASLGLLVSGVAHDLNNPLTAISGYTQMMLIEEDQTQRADDLRDILFEVDRCRKIITDLLGFVRRRPTERVPVAIGHLLHDTIRLREKHLDALGIDRDIGICEELPPLLAVGHQLQQVFINILLNAEQALQQSGSRLRVHASCAEGETPGVVLEFYNDGPGIPADVLDHIFDPLFTTKSGDQGTGLGLAISRRIVREHGGDIRVVSSDQGTTFEVRLPVEAARDAANS